MSNIGTVEARVTVRFDGSKIRQLVNQHHLGIPNCNKWDEEQQKFVDACEFPEGFKEINAGIIPNINLKIEADVDENGKLCNFRVVNGD
jgi:hypothetical protein